MGKIGQENEQEIQQPRKETVKNGALQNRGKGQGENTRKNQNELYIEHTSGKEEGKREDYISRHEQGEQGENTR